MVHDVAEVKFYGGGPSKAAGMDFTKLLSSFQNWSWGILSKKLRSSHVEKSLSLSTSGIILLSVGRGEKG